MEVYKSEWVAATDIGRVRLYTKNMEKFFNILTRSFGKK